MAGCSSALEERISNVLRRDTAFVPRWSCRSLFRRVQARLGDLVGRRAGCRLLCGEVYGRTGGAELLEERWRLGEGRATQARQGPFSRAFAACLPPHHSNRSAPGTPQLEPARQRNSRSKLSPPLFVTMLAALKGVFHRGIAVSLWSDANRSGTEVSEAPVTKVSVGADSLGPRGTSAPTGDSSLAPPSQLCPTSSSTTSHAARTTLSSSPLPPSPVASTPPRAGAHFGSASATRSSASSPAYSTPPPPSNLTFAISTSKLQPGTSEWFLRSGRGGSRAPWSFAPICGVWMSGDCPSTRAPSRSLQR